MADYPISKLLTRCSDYSNGNWSGALKAKANWLRTAGVRSSSNAARYRAIGGVVTATAAPSQLQQQRRQCYCNKSILSVRPRERESGRERGRGRESVGFSSGDKPSRQQQPGQMGWQVFAVKWRECGRMVDTNTDTCPGGGPLGERTCKPRHLGKKEVLDRQHSCVFELGRFNSQL